MIVNVTSHAIERSTKLFKVGNLKKYCTYTIDLSYELLKGKEFPFSCVIRDYEKDISVFVEFVKYGDTPIAIVSTVGTLVKYPREGETVVYINENKTLSLKQWSKDKHNKDKASE